MQYENIPTVRLLIIAEILGFIAAELLPGRAAVQMRSIFCRFECCWSSVSPYISAIITSRTVGIFSYCMSHCRFEGGNIPSDWNSIPLGNEKSIYTVEYQVVRATSSDNE